jgi:hypothetical protein
VLWGLGNSLVTLILLAQQAGLMMDAILQTLVRLFITRRNLLRWVTALQAKTGASHALKNLVRPLVISSAVTLIAGALVLQHAEAMAGIRSASEPYAALLARTSRERFQGTWALAETGATGPTGNSYGDAAGHCCLAVSGPVEEVITLETGSADRVANMHAFAAAALDLLAQAIARSQPGREQGAASRR